MIGELPTALTVGGVSYSIRTDYRIILNICQAFNDPDLTEQEKCYVCIRCLFENYEKIPREHLGEAVEKAYWFVGGGDIPQEDTPQAKVMDWEQDEHIIFPAVSKVAGYEVRSAPYLHWWVFIGLFNEIGEGLFTSVISLRSKINKHKKLERSEREFYRQHKHLIDLRQKKSQKEIEEEQEDQEFLKQLLAGDNSWQTDI